MGFSRQEYWSRWPFPPPGDLSDPETEPVSLMSPALAGRFFTTSTIWEALKVLITYLRADQDGGCRVTPICLENLHILMFVMVTQMVKNLPALQETWVRSLGWEDPLEEGMATHSSILAWETPWTEEPRGLQSTGSQRVGYT